MNSSLPINSTTAFLPTYIDLQSNQEQLRIVLTDFLTDVSYGVNIREIAQFETVELLNGQQFFDPNNAQRKRYVYRKVIDFGALPNNTSKSVAHNIVLDDGVNDSTYFFTKLHATAYDPTVGNEQAICIDGAYYDIAGGMITNPINCRLTSTDIVITTTSDRTNFTQCLIVLEYMKN